MFSQNGHSASTRINDRIDNLATNLKSAVEQMSKQAYTAKEKASASASSFIAKTGQAIKDHPIAAVGIAFGLGYLVMRALRR
jgi:ElaB/YqjD/DUF883 family membrane-anchored ribosome-binding protein